MTAPRAQTQRRGTPSVLLIVGLANPGEEYEHSRHNVGGDAVRLLAQRRGVSLSAQRRQRAQSASLHSTGGLVTLAVPVTYMNESGAALVPLLRRASLASPSQLVVVHDELDLEPGRVQLKMGGGLAGHNGLRSIARVIKSTDFARLRIGIGKPPSKDQGSDWVLSSLRGARRLERDENVSRAADVLEELIDLGFDEAQRRANGPRG